MSQRHINNFCVPKSVNVLHRYFLFRIGKAENDLDAEKCSRINTRSACEYTVFAPAQFLRSYREQRPTKEGDLDSSITTEVWTVYSSGRTFLV
jgi:hypothetical protein